MMTYISLFSSAGVGCYGFKTEGFECIATNELIERRLNVQKANRKCKYDSGYICGDITAEDTKRLLYAEIDQWKQREKIKGVDVVIATPPCQGMSVANHKKSNTEIVRNSLVVESIKIIKVIRPKFFVFENVPAFMKTICTDVDGIDKPIAEAIRNNLGADYSYTYKIINFKHYGACSSRTRTIVIGVSKEYADEVSSYELYPERIPEKTLRQVIGDMRPLKVFGEIDPSDIYHAFRTYPEHMREWIKDLEEGESAFDNPEDAKKPHQVINGKIVINQQKNGDKYKRQFWDKIGPCVHTRNDQLASQNTIHPADDRVFSIRELMRMMTVPDTFKWTDDDLESLNRLPIKEKQAYLKKEEIKIRQSLGEAVPTVIFNGIAKNIKKVLEHTPIGGPAIMKIVTERDFASVDKLRAFIDENPLNLSLSALGRIAELSNTERTDNGAYYTNKALITEMLKCLPDTEKDTVRILEPSAGVGNFIPLILKKFEGKNIVIDLVDIDPCSSQLSKILLEHYGVPENCTINYITDDFLTHDFEETYDYVIGNPPFFKMKSSDEMLKKYQENAINQDTTNICSFFLDKIVGLADYVAIVFPKFILNTPEFAASRKYLSRKALECIIDFGENGFPGVLIETVALFINNNAKPKDTRIVSMPRNIDMIQKQKYIFDQNLPYWVIYRNSAFDHVCGKMVFDRFTVFRDRQLTNSNMQPSGNIRVLKSRNISDDGREVMDIDGYDAYIDAETASQLSVYEFLDRDDVYLTPNMTYNPRVMKKPKGMLVNGSVAILIPKSGFVLTQKQMEYFSSKEYREFYQIARNYQTRSLNVDACSVYFFGVLKEGVSPMTRQGMEAYINSKNFDLRISGNGRWIDQKCTPDVIWSVSDFVLNYADEVAAEFNARDIWNSEYARLTIADTFSKPGTDDNSAEKEYDKVFSQPLCLLCYAGIIADTSKTARHRYVIREREVLEFIARNDSNAMYFLEAYIEKVLTDSGLFGSFQNFFDHQDKNHFQALKDAFVKFYHDNTEIKKNYEPMRIFTKVLNPLARKYGSRGTKGGRLSPNVITRAEMMYNRDNFRDVYKDKPKEVSRKDWLAAHPEIERRDGYFEQQMNRAKRTLKDFTANYRDGKSELTLFAQGQEDLADATQIHHIFPKNEFPEIMHYVENLIALTPNQHFGYAHPNNNTQIIDPDAQKSLLLAKAESIRQNLLEEDEKIYDFANFLLVLSIGWNDASVLEIEENDFTDVLHAINAH